jgi:sRNA-binding protein
MTVENGEAAATASTVSEGQNGECLEGLLDTKSKPSLATLIRTVDELLPVFTAEPWRQHKPLAVGIDKALTATGILKPWEVGAVLRRYCGRRMYRQALASGGSRFNLTGDVVGEVTPQEAEWARVQLGHFDARQAELAAAQRTAREQHKREREAGRAKATAGFVVNRRADRTAANKPNGAPPHCEASPEIIAAQPSPPALGPSGGDGLAGLRAAAAARRVAKVNAKAPVVDLNTRRKESAR